MLFFGLLFGYLQNIMYGVTRFSVPFSAIHLQPASRQTEQTGDDVCWLVCTWHINAIYTNNLLDGVPSLVAFTLGHPIVLSGHPCACEWLSQANEIKSPSPRSTATVLIIIMTMTSLLLSSFMGHHQPRKKKS